MMTFRPCTLVPLDQSGREWKVEVGGKWWGRETGRSLDGEKDSLRHGRRHCGYPIFSPGLDLLPGSTWACTSKIPGIGTGGPSGLSWGKGTNVPLPQGTMCSL